MASGARGTRFRQGNFQCPNTPFMLFADIAWKQCAVLQIEALTGGPPVQVKEPYCNSKWLLAGLYILQPRVYNVWHIRVLLGSLHNGRKKGTFQVQTWSISIIRKDDIYTLHQILIMMLTGRPLCRDRHDLQTGDPATDTIEISLKWSILYNPQLREIKRIRCRHGKEEIQTVHCITQSILDQTGDL